MYVAFYVGALANLTEIGDLFSVLPFATQALMVTIVTAAVLIPVRAFLVCAVLFHAPRIGNSIESFGFCCCLWMCSGRSPLFCYCTTSTTEWLYLARHSWCTHLLLSVRCADGGGQGG